MEWPVKCPVCGEEIDSMDSIADSRADLRIHIANQHPESEVTV